jgi:hypothetical protein
LVLKGAMHITPTNALEECFDSPTGVSSTVVVVCIVSEVWNCGLTYIPIEDIAAYCCGISSQTKYLVWWGLVS